MDILEEYKHVKEHGELAEVYLWMEEAAKEIKMLRESINKALDLLWQ